MKFLPTVLGKTLQIFFGERKVEASFARCSSSPIGDRLGALFLRFSGCFASVFPSSHSSRSPASLVSQPCVKVGKTRPTQRPLQSRYAEQGGKKKTRQKTRLWWGGGGSVTTWHVDVDVIAEEPRNPRRTRLEHGARVLPAKSNNRKM